VKNCIAPPQPSIPWLVEMQCKAVWKLSGKTGVHSFCVRWSNLGEDSHGASSFQVFKAIQEVQLKCFVSAFICAE
jgi:hypothetical protein